MKNSITYEQAVKINPLDAVASVYEEISMRMMRYFMSNTLAQLAHADFYYDLMEVTQAYFTKDYSNFLFKQTEKMHDEYVQFLPEVEKAKTTFAEMAQLLTKLTIENGKATDAE